MTVLKYLAIGIGVESCFILADKIKSNIKFKDNFKKSNLSNMTFNMLCWPLILYFIVLNIFIKFVLWIVHPKHSTNEKIETTH